MDSLVFDVAVGTVFMFATFALLVSTLTEGVTRFLGLRGEYLLRGIRLLVDGKSTFKIPDLEEWGAFFGRTPKQPGTLNQKSEPLTQEPEPLTQRPNIDKMLQGSLAVFGDKGRMPNEAGNIPLKRKDRRNLPSYISARSFARAILVDLVPIDGSKTTFQSVEAWIDTIDDDQTKKIFDNLAKVAEGNVDRFRQSVEEMYDDQMARVSGWYKRHVRWITLAVAIFLALLLNVNAVRIGSTLYNDEALRGVIASQASSASDCQGKTATECIQSLGGDFNKARIAGLPIGWNIVPECVGVTTCSWADKYGITASTGGWGNDLRTALLLLFGYSLMILAVLPGARFWFDLLGRFGSLRSTGPKPPEAVGSPVT